MEYPWQGRDQFALLLRTDEVPRAAQGSVDFDFTCVFFNPSNGISPPHVPKAIGSERTNAVFSFCVWYKSIMSSLGIFELRLAWQVYSVLFKSGK